MGTTYDRRDGGVPARVAVYRLSDQASQQAVLDDFRTAAMLGVRALGTEDETGPRLTVRCGSVGDEVLVDHVVRQLDPQAERLDAGERPVMHPSRRTPPPDEQAP